MRIRSFFIALMAMWLALPAHAQTSDWFRDWALPTVQLRILATGPSSQSDGAIQAGLEVQLEGDWKTYWRTPGAAGFPPEVDWSQSTNLKEVKWSWPKPVRYEVLGLTTLGYKHEVVFPLKIIPKDPSKPIKLVGKATIPACTNVCTIATIPVAMNLDPANLQQDLEATVLIERYAALVPDHGEQSSLKLQALYWDNQKHQLTVEASSQASLTSPDVIAEGAEEGLDIGAPKITRFGEHQLKAVIPVTFFGIPEYDLSDHPFTITLINGEQSAEYKTHAQSLIAGAPKTTEASVATWAWMLLLALGGGLILNLMPCVLPVLSMKLIGVVEARAMERQQIRRNFIASALGILVSMWILAGGLIALKLGGQSIGWGLQFQSPLFLGFMAIILSLFAANLLGLFEVQLPSFLTTRLAQAGDNSQVGHFIQGMVATLLATPCSAPLMVTAVGFALAGGPLHIILIFTALGLGLALPFIAVAIFPQVVKVMPKPGAWMNRLRHILGVLLLLTLGWILYLLTNFLSEITQLVVLTLILLFWSWMILRHRFLESRPIAIIGLLILSGGIASCTYYVLKPEQPPAQVKGELGWRPLRAQSIAAEVDKGNVVFVDVTAKWCVTCLVNKVNVILREPVYSALQAKGVVLMQGDWTRPSTAITDYMKTHNTYGVPLNVVYGPGAPEGIVLPPILTDSIVMEALKKAR